MNRSRIWWGCMWLIALWVVTGCAATGGAVKTTATGVDVCVNGRCENAEAYDRERIVAGLLAMFKANENSYADICTLDKEGRECVSHNVRFFVQGGPIPGIGTYGELYLFQVALDKQTMQVKFLMEGKARWIGTPLLCSDAAVTLTVASPREITMESNPLCTWLVFPGVYNMKFFIRSIDFDKSTLTGEYSVTGAGLLNLGGGSNPFRMTLPKSHTLVAKGETKASLPTLTALPATVLSLAAPTEEEAQRRQQEVSDEERSLWEKVSRAHTVQAYREYLTRYPQGRFQSTARAQIQVIEAREEQERDLEYWGRIKDSKDPVRFDEYLQRFPKGLFAETAAITAQRLRASATVAATLAEEDALWEKVRGTVDPEQIKRYLDTYPQGVYAAQARRRLENLRAARERREDLELRMWEQIKGSRNVEDFKRYL
ncbi:MAG: hypothetical protein N2Z74_02690, partial [Syntrophales bacterium]|nr:hypothetical protein [Syntrophales bacterium]